MWNPLEEPTNIPELNKIHSKMRIRHKTPSLELYNEYWNMLISQSFHYSIEMASVGGNEFAKRMRAWRIQSMYIKGLEQKIQTELFALHVIYKETIVPCQKVDYIIQSVKQFVTNKPSYKRLIPTVLGYPKYKTLYGCCGLGIPPIPAIGFQSCLCKTYIELYDSLNKLLNEIEDEQLLEYLTDIKNTLRLWKSNEVKERFQ